MNATPPRFARVFLSAVAIATASTVAAQIPAHNPPPPEEIPALPAGAESWLGKYAGNGVELEFRATVFGFVAVLKVNGASGVAHPQVDGDRLTGTFGTDANEIPFEATRQGTQLRLVAGSHVFLLQRQGAGPAVEPKTPTASAETPPPPTVAPLAGKRVQMSQGYSLQLPEGWTSQEAPDGVMLLPAGVRFDPNRNDNPEAYLMTMRNDYDPREEPQLAEQFNTAVAQNGGTGGKREALTLGDRSGAVYRSEFLDPASGKPAAFDIFMVPEGNKAIVLVAVGERARVRAQNAAVRQVLSSISFGTAPVARVASSGTPSTAKSAAPPAARSATLPTFDSSEPLADNTPEAQRWLAKLRGKLVRQFWASQGMSSDKRHMLAADGTYSYKSASMVAIDVPGASASSIGSDNTTGRWHIRDVSGQIYLEVRLNNGETKRMRITQDNRNWYLNGEKAFAVDP